MKGNERGLRSPVSNENHEVFLILAIDSGVTINQRLISSLLVMESYQLHVVSMGFESIT